MLMKSQSVLPADIPTNLNNISDQQISGLSMELMARHAIRILNTLALLIRQKAPPYPQEVLFFIEERVHSEKKIC